jgi:inner membrane protein
MYFSIPIGLAAFSAIFSHLFMDMFTVNGCPLLYPLREIRFVALRPRNRVRTGTRQEKAVFIFLTMIVVSGLLCYFNLFDIVDGHLYPNDNKVTVSETANNTTNTTSYYNRDKSNINLNVYPDKKGEKNITIEYGDQKTNILIENLDDEK